MILGGRDNCKTSAAAIAGIRIANVQLLSQKIDIAISTSVTVIKPPYHSAVWCICTPSGASQATGWARFAVICIVSGISGVVTGVCDCSDSITPLNVRCTASAYRAFEDKLQDKVNDRIGKYRNQQSNDRIENRIFGCGDSFFLPARDHVAKSTKNQHHHADNTDGIEENVDQFRDERTIAVCEISWNATATSSVDATGSAALADCLCRCERCVTYCETDADRCDKCCNGCEKTFHTSIIHFL